MSRADMSRAWKERPVSTFFATGCGIGMIPFAPGTWGSVEGLAVWYVSYRGAGIWGYPDRLETTLKQGGHWVVTKSWFGPVGLFFSLVLALIVIGIIVSWRTEELSSKDPGPVVVDEVAGQFLALAIPTCLGFPFTVSLLGIAFTSFLLFRLFDIWKPWPIKKLQDLPGGWGIMLDDVAAGILAGAITYGIGRLL